jgi:uncharacterized membrane protein YdbT with pleckstrin-like domain
VTDFVVRPSIKFVRFGYVAVFVLIGIALAAASNYEAPLWLAAVAALLLLWPAQRHLHLHFTKMTVTGDRLRYECGLLSKTTRTIQLSKVQDIRVDQSLGQRLAGVGNVSIETAGETSRLVVAGIDDPQGVADRLIEASHQRGKANA